MELKKNIYFIVFFFPYICCISKQPAYYVSAYNSIDDIVTKYKTPTSNAIITNIVLQFNGVTENFDDVSEEPRGDDQDIIWYYPNKRYERDTDENKDSDNRKIYNALDDTLDEQEKQDDNCNNDDSSTRQDNEEKEGENNNKQTEKREVSKKESQSMIRKVRQTELSDDNRQFVVGTFQAVMQPQPAPTIPNLNPINNL